MQLNNIVLDTFKYSIFVVVGCDLQTLFIHCVYQKLQDVIFFNVIK